MEETNNTEIDVRGFLRDLAELSLKYNIAIGGYDGDGAPYLMKCDRYTDINGTQHDSLTWNSELKMYSIGLSYPTPEGSENLRG